MIVSKYEEDPVTEDVTIGDRPVDLPWISGTISGTIYGISGSLSSEGGYSGYSGVYGYRPLSTNSETRESQESSNEISTVGLDGNIEIEEDQMSVHELTFNNGIVTGYRSPASYSFEELSRYLEENRKPLITWRDKVLLICFIILFFLFVLGLIF